MLKLPESTDVKAQVRRILRPKTKLGKTTLWFGMVTGVLELLRLIFRSPQGSLLSGWTSFISFVFLVCVVLMLLRWVRRRLMWRLRNRLIVTYVFIGIIPMLLLVAMATLAGYLFAGQFSTYIAISNLRSELGHLEAANNALAIELRHFEQDNKLNPKLAADVAAASEENFLQRSVSVWEGDKGFVIPPVDRAGVKREPFRVNDKIQGNFAGIVMDRDRLHLRAVRHPRLEDGRQFTVISDVPITAALLRKTAAQLGSITLLPPVPVAEDESLTPAPPSSAKPSGAKPAGAKKDNFSFTLDQHKVELSGASAKDVRQRVSAGEEPPAQNRFDVDLVFGTLFPVTDWELGNRRVRASALPPAVSSVPHVVSKPRRPGRNLH